MDSKKIEKKYPKVVVGAFIFNDNNELLLIKAPKWHNKYTCLGGKVEIGESLKETVIREIREEANLDIFDIEFIWVTDGLGLKESYKKEDNHFIFADYLAKVKNAENLKLNEEGSDYKWLGIDEWLKKKESKFAPYVTSVLKKIKNKKEEVDFKKNYLRALADYQNLLKQTVKEKQEFAKYANANLIIEILPVVNNFKMAVKHIPEDQKYSQWIQGIAHIQNQLLSVLSANGIEEIKTVGEKFNPELHEAVKNNDNKKQKENPSAGGEKGIIIKEVIPGYKMHGKVIIPAKVIVNL